jgi:hemerythrin-like domain-containing protein
MTTSMAPLREEHQELLPRVEILRAAADAVGSGRDALVVLLGEAFDFLVLHLIPHAAAEDSALYPEVQRVMGAREATATMSRDHVEVHRLTEALGTLRARVQAGESSGALDNELRRVLYGLHALIRLHFAKEEEVYVPLLAERLTEAEARAMFRAMEGAGSTHEH